MIVLLLYMQDKQWLLVQEQIDEAAEHGRGIVDARVGGLEEEVRQQRGCLLVSQPRHGAYFVDDAAEQHRLALAGITLDPEQPALRVIAPLSKVSIVEYPEVRAFQQAAFGPLDTTLVVAWISNS